jgi:hypothetical protein
MAVALATLLAATLGASATAAPRTLPHVTLIGDSVADSLQLDPAATETLAAGTDLELDVEPCRRLEGTSCPNQQGVRPPTAVDLIRAKGTGLGDTVVIAVGYNDDEDAYPAEIGDALGALAEAGVKHVLWLTLRQVRHPYVTMDDAILAAAAAHPGWMSVVDWNAYARGQDAWFAPDGIHLSNAGAEAMARLIRSALVDAGVAASVPAPAPLPVRVATFKLPLARLRTPYAAKLTASGGRAPYRWWSARLPRGVRLLRDGSVVGRPVGPSGSFRVWFHVSDARGKIARRLLVLTVA